MDLSAQLNTGRPTTDDDLKENEKDIVGTYGKYVQREGGDQLRYHFDQGMQQTRDLKYEYE